MRHQRARSSSCILAAAVLGLTGAAAIPARGAAYPSNATLNWDAVGSGALGGSGTWDNFTTSNW